MSASPLSNSGERAAAWRAPLAITVAGWLLFETLSGLLILFLPFGLTPQFTVVVHTGVGCLFLLPYLIYQVQHWSTHLSSAWTHVKLTAYVAFGAAMVCVVSGVVLTVQALVGTRIGYVWDLLHTVGTFALLAAAVPHAVTLMLRVWGADLLAPLIAAQQRWFVGTAGFTVLGLIGVAVCIGLYNPRRDRWFDSVKCRCCKETSLQPIVGGGRSADQCPFCGGCLSAWLPCLASRRSRPGTDSVHPSRPTWQWSCGRSQRVCGGADEARKPSSTRGASGLGVGPLLAPLAAGICGRFDPDRSRVVGDHRVSAIRPRPEQCT